MMTPAQTKTDLEMENRMHAVHDDPERVDALAKARAFKRSLLELAETLSAIYERKSWKHWGYDSFDDYCKKELHITGTTASKLLGSFRFLKTSAPKIIERAHQAPEAPIPSMKAIDFVARAEKRGEANAGVLREIRRAAFDEGASVPMLTKRFKEVAFPVKADQKKAKLRTQLTSTGKRLAALLADPDSPLAQSVASTVEEAIGEMLRALEADRPAADKPPAN
ncbi:MAG: hypothetical protein KJO07_05460 [Deltaproteobacteria bacterium]|nr:hypothetical protein [Deltaproteobacteria bacterium]